MLSLVAAGAIGASCGSDAVTPPGAAAGAGGSGETAGSGGSSTSGLNTCGECDAGTYCSAIGECIDDGTCAHEDDCQEGTTCDVETGECVPGGDCGTEQIEIEYLRPSVLFVVDRSCSLTNNQFNMVEAAITNVTTSYMDEANWGLILFPDTTGANCDQDDVQVPIAVGTELAVQEAMMNTKPNGPCVTNISQALAVAADQFAASDESPGSVVFFTDGKQSNGCGGNSEDPVTVKILEDLLADKDVPTYVIGFGSGVAPADLNSFAVAGGKPLPDPETKYYLTEDQATLDDAFTAIIADTISCDYALLEAPPEGEEIYVFFDDDPAGVPQDETHMNGWDYDEGSNTITFYGSYCESLTNAVVSDVDIVFGCPAPTPD